MINITDSEKLHAELTLHVDVLIEHSDNYHVMSREAAKSEPEAGGRTFNLIRCAVEHEIVARLYRLIEDIPDGEQSSLMMKHLSDDCLLEQMMPKFDHDGSKSLDELKNLRDEIVELFEGTRTSEQFAETEIYRQRFFGHRVVQPRILKKLPPTADVTKLSSAELRWLTDSLANI